VRSFREREEWITREQAAMVHAVAASPDRVVCVVGHAGSGKTRALAALAESYQREGFLAIGAAPSGVAAANLAAETGLASGTLHRLLAEAKHRGGLPRDCLVVVDEAGMADTRTLTRLLWQAEHAHAKLVLLGDPSQLPAVGPSGLYAAIVERKGAIELTENRRQHDELERRALALLRGGQSRDYLAHAAARGRLDVADNRTEAKARLVADWWQSTDAKLAGSVMIAYRRADVAELNTVARTLLNEQGRLGREQLRLDNGLELAVGERILCTRNDRQLQIANGNRGTIAAIDRTERAVLVELDDSRRVTLPARYLEAGHVSYGYALTGHKTQGLTVERAFVLADDRRALKEWGYVALSRARCETRLYAIANQLEPDASPHRIEPAAPVDRLAEALSRPAAETLALDAARRGRPLPEHLRLALENRRLRERLAALEKERLDAARELHQTKGTLEDLGPLGRARRGRTCATGSRSSDERSRASTASASESRNSNGSNVSAPSNWLGASPDPSAASPATGASSRGWNADRASSAGSSSRSEVDAQVALEPKRPLQADLHFHDPPQLTRAPDLQLAQPLCPPTLLLAELLRERSRHPRQIGHRRHPQSQAFADVLERRAPAQIVEPPPRPRRL
jgi:AAA domain